MNSKTTPCPDCAQTVSLLAQACPHCGRPLQQKSPDVFLIVLKVFGSIILIGVIIYAAVAGFHEYIR